VGNIRGNISGGSPYPQAIQLKAQKSPPAAGYDKWVSLKSPAFN